MDVEFKDYVKDITNNEYELKSEYVKSSIKVKIRHNKCGNEYEVTPNHFQQGRRCPYCCNTQKLSIRKVQDTLDSKYGKNNYSVISKTYKNNKTPILVKHNICGHKFKATPNCLVKKKGTKCPYCFPMKVRKTNEQFLQEVYDAVGNEFTFLEDYVTNDTKIKVRHNCDLCNNYEFKVRPYNFLKSKIRCPKCIQIKEDSYGVRKIKKYLDSLDIHYLNEYKIYANTPRVLKLDFYLEEYNLAIEFDGKQHFQKSFGSSNEEFKKAVIRDKHKNDYCKEHNIPLLRISYLEENNIEEILESFLLKHDCIEYI
jgi:very-short-patch-repair endonuclease